MATLSTTTRSTTELQEIADGIRRRAIELTIKKNGCYLSQALSSAEILALLYGKLLTLGPSEAPAIPERFSGVPRPGFHPLGAGYNGPRGSGFDRLLLSAAHYAVAVYSALVEVGRMAPEGLDQFNDDGSSVEMIGAEHSPGMELTTGSFGQALSQAGGIALARSVRGEDGRVFVFMSDGEFEEGQTYEAVQACVHYKLDNVVVFVDVNGQQVDGATKDVMNIEPLADRLSGFGAAVERVDGHDIEAMERATRVDHAGKPLVVLCYTDTARGVPMLAERKPYLHYVRFKTEDEKQRLAAFLAELRKGA
jgi:transketolase